MLCAIQNRKAYSKARTYLHLSIALLLTIRFTNLCAARLRNRHNAIIIYDSFRCIQTFNKVALVEP